MIPYTERLLMQISFTRSLVLPVLAALLLSMAGCASRALPAADAVFAYAAENASFTAHFPSTRGGEITCPCSGCAGQYTIRKSDSAAVILDGSACRIETGGAVIPLSESVSGSLVSVFSLLSRGNTPDALLTEDAGGGLLVRYPDGTVTLARLDDGSFVPVLLEGDGRSVAITDWSAADLP